MRPAEPGGEHPARVAVEHDDGPIAPAGTTEVHVPSGAPVEAGLVGHIDDETVRAGMLCGDGDGLGLRENPRRRRAWMRLHDASAGKQQQAGELKSHARP